MWGTTPTALGEATVEEYEQMTDIALEVVRARQQAAKRRR